MGYGHARKRSLVPSKHGALRIAQLASQYGVDYSENTSDRLSLVFSSYNSGKLQDAAGPYGVAPFSYYLAFKNHMAFWER